MAKLKNEKNYLKYVLAYLEEGVASRLSAVLPLLQAADIDGAKKLGPEKFAAPTFEELASAKGEEWFARFDDVHRVASMVDLISRHPELKKIILRAEELARAADSALQTIYADLHAKGEAKLNFELVRRLEDLSGRQAKLHRELASELKSGEVTTEAKLAAPEGSRA